MENETILRRRLNNNAFLGSLYDIRKEEFCGTILFKKELDPSLIRTNQQPSSNFKCIFEETSSHKFNSFKIDGELAVNILAGLVELSGSGRYFVSEKKTDKSIRCTLASENRRKLECVSLYDDKVKELISIDALETRATHVVTGIIWGANIYVTLDYSYENNQNKNEVEGKFDAAMKKLNIFKALVNTNAKVDAKLEKDENELLTKLDVDFFGDIELKSKPTTIEGALEIINEIQTYIDQTNDGKGAQIEFQLVPLDHIRAIKKAKSLEQITVRKIDANILTIIQQRFDQNLSKILVVNDNFNYFNKLTDYLPKNIVDQINKQRDSLIEMEENFKAIVANMLPKLRLENNDQKNLIEDIFKNEEIQQKGDEFIAECNNWKIMFDLEMISQYKENNMHCLTKFENLFTYLKNFDNLEKDIFVLYTSSSVEYQNETLQNFRKFKDLQEKNKNSKFFVINIELHGENLKIKKPCIAYYSSSELITSDLLNYYDFTKLGDFLLVKNVPKYNVLDYTPHGVLVGKKGAGMTTLFDKVCGTNHVGVRSLKLFDLPGFDWSCDPDQISQRLFKVLTNNEINTIFIFISYYNKFNIILRDYLDLHAKIEKLEKKIVLVITHWDLTRDPDRDFSEICRMFNRLCNNIIFYSEFCDTIKMANLMYAFMSNMNKEKLQMTYEEFTN